MTYWINMVSHDHVKAGMEGRFTQANHGRATNLRRLSKGDLIAFYSPRMHFRSGEPLQQFAAIAHVTDEKPYQVEMTPTFHPWRRRVEFVPCEEAPIQPLIEELGFIKDKRQWGFVFRRGLFEICGEEFHRITQTMKAEIKQEHMTDV